MAAASDVGNVRRPDLVRTVGLEILIDDIFSNRQFVPGKCRRPVLLFDFGSYAVLAHKPCDAVFAAFNVSAFELGCDAGAAVKTTAVRVYLLDRREQFFVFNLAFAFAASKP